MTTATTDMCKWCGKNPQMRWWKVCRPCKMRGNERCPPVGEDHHDAVLNEVAVRFARAAYRHGDFERHQDIAEHFGIDASTVGSMIRRNHWKDVTDEVEPYDVRGS